MLALHCRQSRNIHSIPVHTLFELDAPSSTKMRSSFIFATLIAFFFSLAAAQYDYDQFMSDRANAPTPTALSPEAQASLASVSSAFAALITGPVQGGGARSGDAASAGDDDGDLAGASGGSNDSIKISKAGIIAIAVVVSVVVVFGSEYTRVQWCESKELTNCSRFDDPLLPRQETQLGSQSHAQAERKESRYRSYTKTYYIPKRCIESAAGDKEEACWKSTHERRPTYTSPHRARSGEGTCQGRRDRNARAK